jgi:hypothetical protein
VVKVFQLPVLRFFGRLLVDYCMSVNEITDTVFVQKGHMRRAVKQLHMLMLNFETKQNQAFFVIGSKQYI